MCCLRLSLSIKTGYLYLYFFTLVNLLSIWDSEVTLLWLYLGHWSKQCASSSTSFKLQNWQSRSHLGNSCSFPRDFYFFSCLPVSSRREWLLILNLNSIDRLSLFLISKYFSNWNVDLNKRKVSYYPCLSGVESFILFQKLSKSSFSRFLLVL